MPVPPGLKRIKGDSSTPSRVEFNHNCVSYENWRRAIGRAARPRRGTSARRNSRSDRISHESIR